MNLLKLLQLGQKRLNADDPVFTAKVETLLSVLRSAGVVPYKRLHLNNHVHAMFAAALVVAHQEQATVDVATRHQATYHAFGFSTRVVHYIDAAIKQELLIQQPNANAGKLQLSVILDAYLSDDAQDAGSAA